MTDAEIAIIERWVDSGMAAGARLPRAARPVSTNPRGRSDSRTSILAPPCLHAASRRTRTSSGISWSRYPPDATRSSAACSFVPATARSITRTSGSMRARHRGDSMTPIRRRATKASSRAPPTFPTASSSAGRRDKWHRPLSDESAMAVARRHRPRRAIALATNGSDRSTSRPMIGLYFGDRAPSRTPTMIRLGKQDLDIPAGAPVHTRSPIRSCCRSRWTCSRSSRTRITARDRSRRRRRCPTGRAGRCIRIDDWDMNWQDRYVYTSPVRLPAGTRLSMSYVVRQLDRRIRAIRIALRCARDGAGAPPTKWPTCGCRSSPIPTTIARVSVSEISRKMLTEDAIGSEVLLAREPDHINLQERCRANLHGARQTVRRPCRTSDTSSGRCSPHRRAAWFNEGTALEALRPSGGRRSARYRRSACALDPDYSPALATTWVRCSCEPAGWPRRARCIRRTRSTADPANADAHANLGFDVDRRRASRMPGMARDQAGARARSRSCWPA